VSAIFAACRWQAIPLLNLLNLSPPLNVVEDSDAVQHVGLPPSYAASATIGGCFAMQVRHCCRLSTLRCQDPCVRCMGSSQRFCHPVL